MFDPYPRHGHRTPQQIAEDAGGSFEPSRTRRLKIREMKLGADEVSARRIDEAKQQVPPRARPKHQ